MGLTAVAHDLDQLTDVLVEQLLSRLTGDEDTPPKHLVLESSITERTSVKKVNEFRPQ